MTAVKLLTYADYVALPDDGKRYEILDGVLHVTPSPSRRHQRVVLTLATALEMHVRAHNLGEIDIAPFDVILSESNIVEPDIIFVSTDKLDTFSNRGFEGGPTLAIEVLSLSTARTDRTTKLAIYGRHGVAWYWIVDPERPLIDVYRLDATGYAPPQTFTRDRFVDLPPFPGLVLDPRVIWP